MEYIDLSFSYMTFVMKAMIENNYNDLNHPLLKDSFEVEPFTYLLNRDTCFMDSQLIKYHMVLNRILTSLEARNPLYLEQLHYTRLIKDEDKKNMQGANQLIGAVKDIAKNIESGFSAVKSFIMREDGAYDFQRISALHLSIIEGNNRS